MLARETDEQIRVWPGHTNNYFVFQNNNDTALSSKGNTRTDEQAHTWLRYTKQIVQKQQIYSNEFGFKTLHHSGNFFAKKRYTLTPLRTVAHASLWILVVVPGPFSAKKMSRPKARTLYLTQPMRYTAWYTWPGRRYGRRHGIRHGTRHGTGHATVGSFALFFFFFSLGGGGVKRLFVCLFVFLAG